MTGTRGHEIPFDDVMEDGSPQENAAREVDEETERRPGSGFLRPRCSVGSHHLDPLVPQASPDARDEPRRGGRGQQTVGAQGHDQGRITDLGVDQ